MSVNRPSQATYFHLGPAGAVIGDDHVRQPSAETPDVVSLLVACCAAVATMQKFSADSSVSNSIAVADFVRSIVIDKGAFE
jgi:hypothetical protein